MDLFDYFGLEIPKLVKHVSEGEAFEIADGVNPELLEESFGVIEHCMTSFDHVLVTYSGGKDSHTCLQLVIRYKLSHPECTTKISVIARIKTCATIKRWSARDVITYLVRFQAPWEEYGNHNLINLYGSAAGGWEECPIGTAMTDITDGVSACTSGNSARMGCVFCTVVRLDTSLENMAKDYPEQLLPFVTMRKVFKAA